MLYREADELNTYLFHEGTSINAYEFMGAHAVCRDGVDGWQFGEYDLEGDYVAAVCAWHGEPLPPPIMVDPKELIAALDPTSAAE